MRIEWDQGDQGKLLALRIGGRNEVDTFEHGWGRKSDELMIVWI